MKLSKVWIAYSIALVVGCSDTNVPASNATATAAPTTTKIKSSGFSCAAIDLRNPQKANLKDPALVFDVDIPEGFEVRKKTENTATVGYQIGARVNPKSTMVSFGYEIDQAKQSQALVQPLIDAILVNGGEKDMVVPWHGQLLDVYVTRTQPGRADMRVWLPAATEGEYHYLLVTTFLRAKETCTAELTQAMTIFISSLRPKGSG